MAEDDRAEQAFREALRQHADDPWFRPLHVAAPQPRSRTRWLPAAAAVLLVAAIAVPLLIGRLNGAGGSSGVPAPAPIGTGGTGGPVTSGGPTQSTGTLPTPTPGWRWESYRVLTFRVPDDWGYDRAPLSDWCGDKPSKPEGPYVDVTADRAVSDVGCPRSIPAKQLAMFASVRSAGVSDRGWDPPVGWSGATKTLAGYQVEVVFPSAQQSLAEEILGSVRALPEMDENGCPAASPVQDGPEVVPAVQASLRYVVRASLCQYDLTRKPGLLASQSVSATAADYLRQLLHESPLGPGPDLSGCSSAGRTAALVRLWAADGQMQDFFVRYAGCRGNGIFDGTTARRLTEGVCGSVLQSSFFLEWDAARIEKTCIPVDEPAPTPSKTR